MRPPRRYSRVQSLQNNIGVGNRWLAVAPIIADRPRIGAGTARSHLEQTATVYISDRPAAGSHCVDVEHRGFDRITVNHGLAREPALPTLEQCHVAARATHVECNKVVIAGHSANFLRRNYTGARA